MSQIKKLLPPLMPLLFFTALAELLIQSQIIPNYILPAPSEVFQNLYIDSQEFLEALYTTLTSALLGLILSFVVGTFISLLLSTSALAKKAFYPYAVFFQTVPVIALAPVLVIWFGFGQPTAIASAFICSVFPVIASSLLGLQSTDPALIDLFKLYSHRPLDLLFKLKIPFALPQIFNGLKIASGLAVIGTIVGEFIGGGGLGSIIDSARTQQRLDKVFAAVLVTSCIGFIFVSLFNVLARVSLKNWHASEKQV